MNLARKSNVLSMLCYAAIIAAGALLFSSVNALAAFGKEAPPKLILQITVDQLRGDLPERFKKNMGKGGFRYLMDNGVWYANAHYNHGNTETIVGHTTLATGADPAVHGMIGNVWFDRNTGALTYNIEDADYQILTKGASVDKATEIDPTQKVASTDGRSPAAILSSTFSDELALFTAGKAKIFGISVKDRGAVSMAGHAGKAFWFSKKTGEFVTSNYYYDQYPEWVNEWNASKPTQVYANKTWGLLNPQHTYLFADSDDKPWETDFPGFGRTFPHAYGADDDKYFTTRLTLSPAGDALTLDFAKTLIQAENIGQDDITDYLSVSFSSTDYVGHIFGPSSLEMEDNILRLDRSLATLFEFIDNTIGLKNTLIVLSADHGSPESPGYLNSLNIPAQYVNPSEWDKTPAIQAIKKRFGINEKIIQSFTPPYVYLNHKIIQKNTLNLAEIESAVATEIAKLEGVWAAISSDALMSSSLPDTSLTQAVLHNYNAERSGDIYVVFKPHWFINDFDGLTVSSAHGSPWSYDTYVPIVFAGNRLKPQRVMRAVEPVDIAPTLSAKIGAKTPSGARGVPLTETFQ